MRFGLGATVAKVATNIRTFGVSFLKDNLKLFFNFQNTDLEHVGTGSVYFDGSNDKVDFTSSKDLTADFTIAFWIKTQDSSNNFYLNNSAAVGEDYINFYSGTFSVEANNDLVALSSGWSESHVWKHVAITRLGAIWTLYVNGVSSYSATDNTETFTYDRMGTNGSDFGQFYTKNLGIWERALSASEVQNIVYKTYDDLQGTEKTHLYAWYALDSSTDTYNDSQGTNHGTNSGSTLKDGVYADYSPRKPRGVDNSSAALADQIGSGSASFDGTDDYINCGENTDTDGAADLTITAWIKNTNTGGSEPIVSRTKDDNENFALNISGHKIVCMMENGADFSGTAGANTYKNDADVDARLWHHIAMVYDGGGGTDALKLKLYVDGVQETLTYSGTAPSTVDDLSGYDIFIGRQGSNYFNGNIAQVGIWTRALTQEEIQEVSQKQYSELTTSEKTNLTSWWALDEVFLGSNTSTASVSSSFYEGGQIVEDKAGTLSTILVDNYDTLDNWEEQNANSSLSRNADGNLVITASGGSGGARLKSSFTTLETDTMYLTEIAVAGGNDTSIYFRLDDEAYTDVKYGNGYLTPNTAASNTTPECLSYRFKSSSSNTGLYVEVGNIDDGKNAIIKSFKLYKIVSGNYGVLTDA